jgi:hypothetical protein
VDLQRPFRHADALTCGALARHHLTDGTYRLLFPGVSVSADMTVTMAMLAAGAALLHPGAVVGGLAAAAVWDVDVAPPDRTVDLLVGRSVRRSVPGVRLQRVLVPEAEIAVVGGVRVTSPARTAFDLSRQLPRGEAVPVLDALFRATDEDPAVVRALVGGHVGERGVTQVEPVLAWADPRSPSPGASRLRVGLLARGMAVPLVAQRLLDGEGRLVAELALAWPGVRLGLAHTAGVRAAAAAVGWEVLEVRADIAELWGTRTRPAPLDGLVTLLRRAADRWDPTPRFGGRNPGRLPRPPGPDGECDGGLSRLVPV